MFRLVILFVFTFLGASIQWQSNMIGVKWQAVIMDIRPEFIPESAKDITEAPIFNIPLDLQQKIPETGTVILVDFRRPSNQKRLWVLSNRKLLVHCRVAHGKNSGETITSSFSNDFESNQSCIGSFVTGKIYRGEKGLAMRIHGLEQGINDNAYERGIVFHGGDYVSTAFLLKHGRIGRSLGCFVTEPRYNARIIRLCRFGAKLFVSGHEPIKF